MPKRPAILCFFATMVTSATVMDVVFTALHQVPRPNTHILSMVDTFSFNYTFWLNVLAAIAVGWFSFIDRKHPMDMGQHDHGTHGAHVHEVAHLGASQ